MRRNMWKLPKKNGGEKKGEKKENGFGRRREDFIIITFIERLGLKKFKRKR